MPFSNRIGQKFAIISKSILSQVRFLHKR